jgi:hypothetical protein
MCGLPTDLPPHPLTCVSSRSVAIVFSRQASVKPDPPLLHQLPWRSAPATTEATVLISVGTCAVLLAGYCQKRRRETIDRLPHAYISYKYMVKRSGPEATRTPGLRHTQGGALSERDAGVFTRKTRIIRVEPRGFELLISAVQMRRDNVVFVRRCSEIPANKHIIF